MLIHVPFPAPAAPEAPPMFRTAFVMVRVLAVLAMPVRFTVPVGVARFVAAARPETSRFPVPVMGPMPAAPPMVIFLAVAKAVGSLANSVEVVDAVRATPPL